MELKELGYSDQLEQYRREQGLLDFGIGRVVAEHRERYLVRTADGELNAEVTGNLRFTARSREDFPAVGDWVTLIGEDSDLAIIHTILPRTSTLARQAIGHYAEVQVIATNIDFAFLVQAVDRDFNINRIERYLTLCYTAKVDPIIILTKTDLITKEQLSDILEAIGIRHPDIPLVPLSNETGEGYESLCRHIKPGITYCLLGSSGVGKSTLLNKLSGRGLMRTDAISQSTGKGKHITTHRELVVLDGGGILIDNPGMREVGIADSGGGLERAFDQIAGLAQHCRFSDCSHTTEIGCAVLKALEDGEIDPGAWENYQKLERERAHFETEASEKRRNEKIFGRMLKDYKKKDFKGKEGVSDV